MIGKNRFKYSILTAVGGLSLLGGVAGAMGQEGNYLLNGDFSDEWTHWTQYNDTASMGGNEAGGIYIENVSDPEKPEPAIVYQCVDVTGGVEYRFGADVVVPTGQDRPGWAMMVTYWWEGDGCEGALLGVSPHSQLTGDSPGAWYHPTAPANAESAWAALVVQQSAPVAPELDPAPFHTEWDNAYFGRTIDMPDERPDGERPEDDRPALESDPDAGPPDEPQVEGDGPDREPGDEPVGEPEDPQGEPAGEPSDEPQDEPADGQPLELGEPEGEKAPLPPSTGSGVTAGGPDVFLAAGVIGATMAAALGGTLLMPARRRR